MNRKVTVKEIEGLNKAESRGCYEAVLRLLVKDQLPTLMRKFGRGVSDVKHGTERLHFIFTDKRKADRFGQYLQGLEIPFWQTDISVRVEIKYLVVLQNNRDLPKAI